MTLGANPLSPNRVFAPTASWPALLLALLALLSTGCVTEGYYRHRGRAKDPSDAVLPMPPTSPRSLAMFEGETGRIATWADLMEGIGWADYVLVGEIHDDRTAHEVQLALLEDTLASHPGTALALEMFERDEQATVDAYLGGEIDAATLVERTGSSSWAPRDPARGSWEEFYQPLVDAAKLRGAPVVAANAPRRLVRLARTEGYAAMPAEDRALYDLPKTGNRGAYRDRFDAVMTPDGADPREPERRAALDATFRSQKMWDATMAASAVQARRDGATKVVLCLGAFHSDFRGGTAQEIRARDPFARILTVSVVPRSSSALRDDDRGRADIVVYGFDRVENPTPAPDAAIPPDA